MLMRNLLLRLAAAFAAVSAVSVSGQATAQVTGQLEVRLLINASCEVSGSSGGSIGNAVLDFGTNSLLLSAITGQTPSTGANALLVQCNPGLPYTIAFNAGANAATPGDVNTRRMKNAASTNFVSYQLYSDAARATVLTNVGGTADGTRQPVVVYGQVPAQTPPPVGSYSDNVTVTVSF
jgi:spore coat protein U-like protein